MEVLESLEDFALSFLLVFGNIKSEILMVILQVQDLMSVCHMHK